MAGVRLRRCIAMLPTLRRSPATVGGCGSGDSACLRTRRLASAVRARPASARRLPQAVLPGRETRPAGSRDARPRCLAGDQRPATTPTSRRRQDRSSECSTPSSPPRTPRRQSRVRRRDCSSETPARRTSTIPASKSKSVRSAPHPPATGPPGTAILRTARRPAARGHAGTASSEKRPRLSSDPRSARQSGSLRSDTAHRWTD